MVGCEVVELIHGGRTNREMQITVAFDSTVEYDIHICCSEGRSRSDDLVINHLNCRYSKHLSGYGRILVCGGDLGSLDSYLFIKVVGHPKLFKLI